MVGLANLEAHLILSLDINVTYQEAHPLVRSNSNTRTEIDQMSLNSSLVVPAPYFVQATSEDF